MHLLIPVIPHTDNDKVRRKAYMHQRYINTGDLLYKTLYPMETCSGDQVIDPIKTGILFNILLT